MARKHAQILTSIWADDDFAALPELTQRLYLFLLSQPDLSLAGILVARPGAWARRGASKDRDAIESALDDLEAARLIAWDRDTDEVWLRSFHKHNVAGSPKTLIGASRAFAAVASKRLRGCIAESVHPDLRADFAAGLDRLDYPDLRDRVADLADWGGPDADSMFAQVNTPSDGGSATETGDRRRDKGEGIPEKSSPHGPSLALELVTDAPSPATPSKSEYPDDFEQFWQLCPNKTGKGAALKAWRTARKTRSAQQLTDAMRAHAAVWAADGTETRWIKQPSGWLNERRYDDPAPARRSMQPQGRAQRNEAAIRAGLADAQRRGGA